MDHTGGGKVEPFDDEAAAARVDMLGKYLGVPVLSHGAEGRPKDQLH